MADTASKIDAAAEKAFADAAEKKTADAASAKPVAQPVAKPAAKPAPVKKAAAPKKTTTNRKAKPVPRKATAKPAAETTERPALTQLKDKIMATAKTTNTDFTGKAKEAVADIQTRAKAAYDKGAELTAEATEFQKGNFEALVESGKILAAGAQDMGRTYVEDAKVAVETVQADVRKFAAIKSPTELFQLQGEIARRNFDAVVATASKNSEAFLKLANEAFAPVSSRMSLAAEKISKAA